MTRGPAAALASALIGIAASVAEAAPVPCVGGMAGPYPCANVDMLARKPLVEIGGSASDTGNDVWGWTDPTTGKEYAIVGLSNGTSFLDISDPVNPVFLGVLPAPPSGACVPALSDAPAATSFAPFEPDHDSCPSPLPIPLPGFAPTHGCANSLWRDHEVYADHAFIGSEQAGHGLVVFDLRVLRNVPAPPVTFIQRARYCGYGSSHTTSINTTTGFLYANGSTTCSGGAHIVDIRNPAIPLSAGCVPGGYTHDSQCLVYQGPDTAHQGKSICINSNGNRLMIADVTNPSAAVELSSRTYPGLGYVHQGWITADHRYFVLDDETDEQSFNHNTRTYVWNLTDLDAPVMMGFYQGPSRAIDHQQFIHGNFDYQSNYRAGLRILETKDIAAAQLSEVGFFDVYPPDDIDEYGGTWANYPFFRSGVVVVTTMGPGWGSLPGEFFLLRPRFADLAVTVTDAPDPVPAGQNVTYTFTVRNQGPTHASNATLTDALPATMTLVSATASQGTCTGTVIVGCNLGTLANAATATVTIVARANVAGTIANSGVASSDETDTRLGDNTATAQTTVSAAAQAAEPAGLSVDASGNRVLQPNEGPVSVAPSWRNTGTAAITLTGAASSFTGLPGPTYAIADGSATYPAMAPGASAGCTDCYALGIGAATRPAVHWDATFVETVSPSATTRAWTLHVGESFTDVPAASGFFRFVETLLHQAVTGGCTATTYCPAATTTREQMAVFALVSKEGAGYLPPACATPTTFADVPATSPFCRWIEELARRGVVGGCGGGNYCPSAAVSREQMAVFALKTLEGPSYVPAACAAPMYSDVPAASPFCPYVEELTRRGVVAGCGGGAYCPAAPVTREQMSVFLTVTFGLLLYGV